MIDQNFPVLGEIPSIKSSKICPLNFIKKASDMFSAPGGTTLFRM